MGSNMNFKGFSDSKSSGDSFEKPMESFPLTRQPSIYSLTFGEFQNTLGDVGKDFGSMNMDELLKNIWTAEETQAIMYNNNNNISNTNNNSLVVGGGGGGGAFPGVNLQRQGSFTLPRTLSQKTVDEVWRDLMRDGDNGSGGTSAPQRLTLGEMTLEEFLVRAGVVREEPQQIARPSNGNAGYYGYNNTNASLAQNNALLGSTPPIPNCSPGLALTAGGIRAALPPSQQQQQQLRPLQLQQQSEPVFPKHATVAFANPMNLMNGAQLTTQVPRTSVVGIGDRSMNNNLVQAGGLKNEGVCMLDLRNGVTVAAASPGSQISPDVMSKSNKDAASLSPAPFLFGRGRRSSAALEKVIERRQRRMIKNRESAARSRARKQAYTLELEAEVAKLKELNEELQRKQAEIREMQKDQLLEPMRRRWGCKRQCLRRTLTGPW